TAGGRARFWPRSAGCLSARGDRVPIRAGLLEAVAGPATCPSALLARRQIAGPATRQELPEPTGLGASHEASPEVACRHVDNGTRNSDSPAFPVSDSGIRSRLRARPTKSKRKQVGNRC